MKEKKTRLKPEVVGGKPETSAAVRTSTTSAAPAQTSALTVAARTISRRGPGEAVDRLARLRRDGPGGEHQQADGRGGGDVVHGAGRGQAPAGQRARVEQAAARGRELARPGRAGRGRPARTRPSRRRRPGVRRRPARPRAPRPPVRSSWPPGQCRNSCGAGHLPRGGPRAVASRRVGDHHYETQLRWADPAGTADYRTYSREHEVVAPGRPGPRRVGGPAVPGRPDALEPRAAAPRGPVGVPPAVVPELLRAGRGGRDRVRRPRQRARCTRRGWAGTSPRSCCGPR